MTYYYETDMSHGHSQFSNDEHAKNTLLYLFNKRLMVIYKESNTQNGLPFIIVYERKKDG
jgi:hypothetical protein